MNRIIERTSRLDGLESLDRLAGSAAHWQRTQTFRPAKSDDGKAQLLWTIIVAIGLATLIQHRIAKMPINEAIRSTTSSQSPTERYIDLHNRQ